MGVLDRCSGFYSYRRTHCCGSVGKWMLTI
jgi:hypothetical protein